MCDGRIDFYRCKERMTKIKVKFLIERMIIIRYIFSHYRILSEMYVPLNCNREIGKKKKEICTKYYTFESNLKN